ncbi:hypothetical protein Ddc_03118 [Ditylenchus destructor]|nr:hypothetical protein Ddc_03118 [Ditylenchus destructor]
MFSTIVLQKDFDEGYMILLCVIMDEECGPVSPGSCFDADVIMALSANDTYVGHETNVNNDNTNTLNVTDEKADPATLLLRQLIGNSNVTDCFGLILDKNGTIKCVENEPSMEWLIGYHSNQVINQSIMKFVSLSDRQKICRLLPSGCGISPKVMECDFVYQKSSKRVHLELTSQIVPEDESRRNISESCDNISSEFVLAVATRPRSKRICPREKHCLFLNREHHSPFISAGNVDNSRPQQQCCALLLNFQRKMEEVGLRGSQQPELASNGTAD